MALCERSRSSAYSSDLRWRIIWQRLPLSLPAKEVSSNVSVDLATVHRIVCKFESLGNVEKKRYDSRRSYTKLTEQAKLFILHLVIERPGIFLSEIKDEIYFKLGVTITKSALCVFLHREGFTRQRLKLYAIQRSEGLRMKFSSDMALFNAEMLLFLGESGTDCHDSLRKKAYSLRGKPAKKQRLFYRGEHVSVCNILGRYTLLQSC